jgi:hypothetical protein
MPQPRPLAITCGAFAVRPSVLTLTECKLRLAQCIEEAPRLLKQLANLPGRPRGPVAWYPAEVSVIASLHDLPEGPVRDAVLREVLDGEEPDYATPIPRASH